MITNTMATLDAITGDHLTLGQAIKSIRLSEGYKQGEFARKLHLTQSYLSDLENGRKDISPQKAAELAQILDYSQKQFIRLALQDALDKKGLYYKVHLTTRTF